MAKYFVKNGGDDGDTGLTDINAWATLDKALTTVSPGDTIYLKCGSVWTLSTGDVWIDMPRLNMYAYGYGGPQADSKNFPMITHDILTGYVFTPLSTADMFVFRNIQFDHSTDAAGHGYFAFCNNMKAIFYSCIFTPNGANDTASMSYNTQNNSKVINCTAYNGKGYFVHTVGGVADFDFINNIVSTDFSAGIYISAAASVNVSYNCAYNAALYAGPGSASESNTITTDPLFSNAGANDFNLQTGSPCLNTGDPDILNRDDDSRSDRGAWGGAYMLMPVTISTFTAGRIQGYGTTFTLTWSVSGAYDGEVYIVNEGVELDASGSLTTSVSASGTHTFTMMVQTITAGVHLGTLDVYILPEINSLNKIESSVDTPTSRQYVYQIDMDSWTEFANMDVVAAEPLTGGAEEDNIVLILDSSGEIKSYPGSSYTTELSELRSGRHFVSKGYFDKMWFDYEGSPYIAAIILNEDFPSPYYKVNNFTGITAKSWRKLSNSVIRGRAMEITMIEVEVLRSIMFDYSLIGR